MSSVEHLGIKPNHHTCCCWLGVGLAKALHCTQATAWKTSDGRIGVFSCYTFRANTTDRVLSGCCNISKAKYAALKCLVRKQVRQTELLEAGVTTKRLQSHSKQTTLCQLTMYVNMLVTSLDYLPDISIVCVMQCFDDIDHMVSVTRYECGANCYIWQGLHHRTISNNHMNAITKQEMQRRRGLRQYAYVQVR